MRVTRAFLVGASVLTVSLGTTTASQALGWERPWAAHTQSSTRSPAHDEHGKGDDKSHKEVKLNKYNLHHSCKGRDFGFCTQNLTFAPKILGDIGVTTGLIGLAAPAAAAPAAAAPAAAAPAAAAPAAAANPGEPEWCSPGYWRNHPESWVGYNPALTAAGGGTTYSSVFGSAPPRSQLGVRQGAPTNPTLMYVLQFGQYYQNPGFHRNRIADLLSAAHPDINFTGVRVNNCPLD